MLHRSMTTILPAAIALLLTLGFSLAASVNRTIDDYYGDSVTGVKPIYTDGWAYGPNCSTCTITPFLSDLFDRSWHEVTALLNDPYPENVTITFEGTAVWVYCVVPNFLNHSTGALTSVNITFEVDGKMDGFYIHEADGTNNSFYYNVTVYSNTSLAAGEHTIIMSPQRVSGGSYMGLDWVQYTTTNSSTSHQPSVPLSSAPSSISTTMGTSSMTPLPHTHTRVGAIIGGVIGGIVGVLAICGLVVYLLYRRRQQKRAVRDEIEPEEAVQEAKPSTIDPFTYASVSQVASSSESRQVLNVGHMRSLSSPEPETSSLSRSAITTSTAPLTSKKARAETPSSGLRSTATSTEPPSPPPNSESFRTSPTSGYYGGASQFGELSRQIREMEQTVAELRRRQSTDHRATASLMASTQPSIIGSVPRDDVEIRREIVALQVEVERLRAEQALLSQEAPPAYEPREDEDAGGEAQLE